MARGLWRCGVLVVVTLLSACASNTLTVTHPKTHAIPPGQTVALSVEVDVPAPLPVHHEAASRLRERLFGRLVSERIFKGVVHAPDPADYQMEVKIRGAREVSPVARSMLGGMGGPNTTDAAVIVRHQATATIVTMFTVTATAESLPLSADTSLDTAVRRATDRIMEGLR
jgi:hypothetical protein